MYPTNIADSILERIRETVSMIQLSTGYQELMLSVVTEVIKKLKAEPIDKIPSAFLPAVFASSFDCDISRVLNVSSAWFLLQISAHLLDKVEDQEIDNKMTHHDKPGLIVNLSTGLIFTAEYLLDHLEKDGIDPLAAADIRSAFNKQILSVCGGQHDDLYFDHPDLNLCWQIAKFKSGLFFGLGCFAGARLVTSDREALSQAWDYGIRLGLIKQVADDIESFIEQESQKSDLISGRWTLPVAYSMHILPNGNAAELRHCLQNATHDSKALGMAREKMIQAGALVYLKLETMNHALEANKAIRSIQYANFNRKDLAVLLAQTAGMEENDFA